MLIDLNTIEVFVISLKILFALLTSWFIFSLMLLDMVFLRTTLQTIFFSKISLDLLISIVFLKNNKGEWNDHIFFGYITKLIMLFCSKNDFSFYWRWWWYSILGQVYYHTILGLLSRSLGLFRIKLYKILSRLCLIVFQLSLKI